MDKRQSNTFSDGSEGADGLPQSGEGDADAEEVDGAPGHPHHEAHHHEVLERRLRDLPRFLLAPGEHTRIRIQAPQNPARDAYHPRRQVAPRAQPGSAGSTTLGRGRGGPIGAYLRLPCGLGVLPLARAGGVVLRGSGTM